MSITDNIYIQIDEISNSLDPLPSNNLYPEYNSSQLNTVIEKEPDPNCDINPVYDQSTHQILIQDHDPVFDYDRFFTNKIVEYNACTIKQLFIICDYYEILKEIKTNKLSKEQIIEQIIWFESQLENSELVSKRLLMWSYMSKIKNDKKLSKFVTLWKYNTTVQQ